MATKIGGSKGNVTIPTATVGGQTALVTRWTADVIRDIHPADIFIGDTGNNHRAKLGGMYHLVGSCECWFDGDTAASGTPKLSGAGGILAEDAIPQTGFVLQATTGKTFSFSGLISNINVSVEKVGQARVTLNFESSGAVASV